MASRYPEVDIFPKQGIDLRDPSGLEWLSNLWRPERAHQIMVRPGFGQLTQQDCTAQKADLTGAVSQATGGYQRHLGSYLYNNNFGHRQIISVFESVVQYSGSDAPSPTLPLWERAFKTVHGAAKTAVVSIYDITTGAQWEEVLTLRTAENCTPAAIPEAHGHFETTGASNNAVANDFIKFKYHSGVTHAAFSQIGDSVVIMIGEYGVWVYHGIDVAKTKQRVLDSTDVVPNLFGAGFTVGTNYQTKDCEGSVLQPVSGVRGLNGEQFTYLSKSEFPRAQAATLCKGRMVYALRGVLYFSDVGQPGAIMADNFAEIQTEGDIKAIGEHNGQLFAFSETEAHLLQMQQNNRAGAAFANVVSVTHVRIDKRTGCVGPRSIVETPFGVCWVSNKGCHMVGAQQSVQDLSDPIADYWDSGIVNPTTHYYANNGQGGTKQQPEVIYKHVGQPTLSYEPQTETLFVAYHDHILVYQFRHQAWSIWPLATTKPVGNEPQSRQTIECLQMLSDSQGTFIVGGLQDRDEDGLTPATQSPSYYITELGRGGSMDRSCDNEDERRHGWGRYTYAVDPSAATITDDHLFYVMKPDNIFTTDDGTKVIYEFPVYFETFQPATWPPALAPSTNSFTLNLSWDAAFTFEGLGLYPEASDRTNWTIANTATTVNTTANALVFANVTQYRAPLYTLRLSAPVGTTARTNFTVVTATATDQTGTATEGVRVLLWQQQHLYAAADRNSDNRLQSSVEWGMKTGQIGLNEGKVLRVRGINAIMQAQTSANSNLYNSYTVSDYKRLSGQYPDYSNLTPGNRRQEQTNLLRERMLNGRRVFNSLAKWSPVTVANTIYLIDSPELNSVVTSVSSRGEHVSVGLYGYVENKADELTIHRLSLGILETGNRRRKGR